MTTELLTKQDTLDNYSVSTGPTTAILQTFDDAGPPSIHLSWTNGSYTNVSGRHQVINTGQVYHVLSSVGSGTCLLSVQ